MAQQIIDVGAGPAPPAAETTETSYTANGKVNAMFGEMYASVARTPRNSGFTVTRDGTGDNTTALNSFFALLASSGDPGRLEPGTYRTTAGLVYPAGILSLRGSGIRNTIIAPAAATYHGLRIAAGTANGLGGSIVPQGSVGGFTVRGPSTTLTKNGFAAFVLDATTQAIVSEILVEGFDIGFDQINNCYNSTWRNCFTSRNVGTVNVGMNCRTDNQNGCDINYYDMQLTGIETALCISGTGGGYRFYGGSFGTTSTAINDKYGVITQGWNYVGDIEAGGLGAIIFSGLHIEGWYGRHAFRSYGSSSFSVQGSGFNPSANTGNIPPGLYKHTNMAGAKCSWIGNSVGSGTFSGAQICQLTGNNDSMTLTEWDWTSNACTVNGVARSPEWMRSLMTESNLANTSYQRGITHYCDAANGGLPVLVLGRQHLRANGDGAWYQSDNGGTSWAPFNRPFEATQGGANQNVESWHSPGRILMTAGTANTVTFRTNAVSSYPIGQEVEIVQMGTGLTTAVASAGVTINLPPSQTLASAGRYARMRFRNTATDTWIKLV